MPMDFPDLDSLKAAARVHKFRELNPNESETEYRTVLADHVKSIDFIESEEIRNGVGWNKWSDKQKTAMLRRNGCR